MWQQFLSYLACGAFWHIINSNSSCFVVVPVFFLRRLLILVLISEIVDLNLNCGQPWEDGSKSQMVTKSLLVMARVLWFLLVGLFMSFTGMLSEIKFIQPWFESKKDERIGIKPRSLRSCNRLARFQREKRKKDLRRWSLRKGGGGFRAIKPCFLIYGEDEVTEVVFW